MANKQKAADSSVQVDQSRLGELREAAKSVMAKYLDAFKQDLRLLVMQRDPSMQQTVLSIAGTAGFHQIVAASDYEEAIEHIDKPFTMAIIGVRDKIGFEMIRVLKGEQPKCKIIATGLDESDWKAAQHFGANDFINERWEDKNALAIFLMHKIKIWIRASLPDVVTELCSEE